MLHSFVLPLLIGAFGVLQNTLNKKIAGTMGLPLALVINSLVLLACGIGMVFAIRLLPAESVPEMFRAKGGLGEMSAKVLVPGLLGFFIVATAPWAIERAGATRVLIGIIVAQIVVSMLCNFYADGVPLQPTRLAGAALALAGAFLAIR